MKYHPVTAALSAAAAELSSPTARRFYSTRAQQDLQAAFILIVQIGCLAYAFGAQCCQWLEDIERTARVRFENATVYVPFRVVAIASLTPKALPAFTPIALLNPAQKPKRTRKPAQPKAPVKGERDRSPKTTAAV